MTLNERLSHLLARLGARAKRRRASAKQHIDIQSRIRPLTFGGGQDLVRHKLVKSCGWKDGDVRAAYDAYAAMPLVERYRATEAEFTEIFGHLRAFTRTLARHMGRQRKLMASDGYTANVKCVLSLLSQFAGVLVQLAAEEEAVAFQAIASAAREPRRRFGASRLTPKDVRFLLLHVASLGIACDAIKEQYGVAAGDTEFEAAARGQLATKLFKTWLNHVRDMDAKYRTELVRYYEPILAAINVEVEVHRIYSKLRQPEGGNARVVRLVGVVASADKTDSILKALPTAWSKARVRGPSGWGFREGGGAPIPENQ